MNKKMSSKSKPCIIPPEAYVSREYARAETEKLWPKVWQIACREEEIPAVGDFVTYNIVNESIIVVRSKSDEIRAFYNVCQHRGRRLTQGCGNAKQFVCQFHGWRWHVDGESAFVLDPEDWQGALNPDNLRLPAVNVDRWGGWIWINMDPECEPLRTYLEPGATMLDPYELDKMRYRWRKWLYFPCNWKTALEAFNESYHVNASHPELVRGGGQGSVTWSRSENRHGWHGIAGLRGKAEGGAPGMNSPGRFVGSDPRVSLYETLKYLLDAVDATTTETFVNAARRLVDELPQEATPMEVNDHFMASARRDDAARGVVWPELDPGHAMVAGHDWHIFPNSIILQGVTYALCYRARPNGEDPNSCIFEVYVLERFPEDAEPKTEWEYHPNPTGGGWPKILTQDFNNMPEVQQGMKSRGFKGARPSPVQEEAVINFHRTLAEFMDAGAPVEIASHGT